MFTVLLKDKTSAIKKNLFAADVLVYLRKWGYNKYALKV